MKNEKKKAMKDLNKRLIYSSLATLIVVLLIIFSTLPFMGLVLAFILAAVAAVAVWEYAQLAHAKDLHPASALMIEVAILEVLAIYAGVMEPQWTPLPILILFIGLVAFFVAHFKNPSKALVHISLQFFGICYIAVPLGLMLGILYFFSDDLPNFDGRWWLFYLIFVTKITDIGGYFVGRLWGKHPLAPVLSPKKTVEGSVAGLICAILLSAGFHYLGTAYSNGGFTLTLFHSLWLGAFLGILGQVGDLAESLFKRDAVVKDSNALPGLGGILDMVDSLLLTTPIVFFFIKALA